MSIGGERHVYVQYMYVRQAAYARRLLASQNRVSLPLETWILKSSVKFLPIQPSVPGWVSSITPGNFRGY